MQRRRQTLLPRIARAAFVMLALSFIGAAGVAVAGTTRSVMSRFAVGSPQLATAEKLAIAHWGRTPCGGDVTIVWKRQADDVNALSVWSTTHSDPYADPQDNTDCAVQLNPAAQWDWPKLCTIVMHEFGHLTGHQHVPEPGRLMSAVYTKPVSVCATTPEPGVTVARRKSR